VVQEVASGLGVTMLEASTAPSFCQEDVDGDLVQISQYQALSYEPLIEGVQQPQLLLHGSTGITQVGESRDKRIKVRAK
jgi:hypothetical protein